MPKKLTTEEFIKKARKIHSDKYDYPKVKYINNRTKVCIICPIHGEFWQEANSHMRGVGCPKCAGKAKSNTLNFIEKACKIHNGKYDYTKVKYVNNKTKVCIICPEHGEFWQKPSHHLCGSGCPTCHHQYTSDIQRFTTDIFVDKSNKIHNNKYDYTKVEYKSYKEKVSIICHEKDERGNEHGVFCQYPGHHLKGCGCPKCANNLALTDKIFTEKARKIHGDKYDYSKVEYVNNQNKVCIICPEHGEFYQIPHHHLRGHGCPRCIKSKMEEDTILFLEKHKIKYIYQASKKDLSWLGRQRLDFYLPDYKMAIECQGEQHFKPVDFAGKGKEWAEQLLKENILRDKKKNYLCKLNDIHIFYINYDEDILLKLRNYFKESDE